MFNQPFAAFRTSLYRPEELLEGFDPADPKSIVRTVDFAIYRFFVQTGRGNPREFAAALEATHDSSVTGCVQSLTRGATRVIAIMGGHDLARDEAAYADVADIARSLTRSGVLVVSGGGPGAMEAAHLGATLAPRADEDLKTALSDLATQPKLPANLTRILSDDGDVDGAVAASLHAWVVPAAKLARDGLPKGRSLGLPTWYYGHEPFSPLASHIGKYFLNSVREDGLVTVGTGGILYVRGKAGTIQEIFQDAAQNYYKTVASRFSPMVFLETDYWVKTYPVVPVLKALFKDDFDRYVLVTDDKRAATEFLMSAN
jgi:hypothetical protein